MKNLIKSLIFLMILICFFPQVVISQEKLPAELKDEAKEAIGHKLVSKLKENIQKESKLIYLTQADESRLIILIKSLDNKNLSSDFLKNNSVYFVIWYILEKKNGGNLQTYLTSNLGYCDNKSITKTANDLFVQTEKVVTDYLTIGNVEIHQKKLKK